MKYMGSKSRIAKDIVPIIQNYIDSTNCTFYWEPFVGGANIIDKIKCDYRLGTAINPYLIALLSHVQDGGELPNVVDRNIYNIARNLYNSRDVSETTLPLWEIGAIGFLASYNGRFFDGGYAPDTMEHSKKGDKWRHPYDEAKRNLLKQAKDLKGIEFKCFDYREFAAPSGAVIYIDPPYASTKQYTYSKNFDYDCFWDTMRYWSKNNIVIISELEAPDDFECIWEREVKRSINAAGKRFDVSEKLFVMKKDN